MRSAAMRVECSFVVVDLVEQDAARLALRLDHVEAPAARFILHRGARIGIDHLAEPGLRARSQPEVDDDDEAAHRPAPTKSVLRRAT